MTLRLWCLLLLPLHASWASELDPATSPPPADALFEEHLPAWRGRVAEASTMPALRDVASQLSQAWAELVRLDTRLDDHEQRLDTLRASEPILVDALQRATEIAARESTTLEDCVRELGGERLTDADLGCFVPVGAGVERWADRLREVQTRLLDPDPQTLRDAITEAHALRRALVDQAPRWPRWPDPNDLSGDPTAEPDLPVAVAASRLESLLQALDSRRQLAERLEQTSTEHRERVASADQARSDREAVQARLDQLSEQRRALEAAAATPAERRASRAWWAMGEVHEAYVASWRQAILHLDERAVDRWCLTLVRGAVAGALTGRDPALIADLLDDAVASWTPCAPTIEPYLDLPGVQARWTEALARNQAPGHQPATLRVEAGDAATWRIDGRAVLTNEPIPLSAGTHLIQVEREGLRDGRAMELVSCVDYTLGGRGGVTLLQQQDACERPPVVMAPELWSHLEGIERSRFATDVALARSRQARTAGLISTSVLFATGAGLVVWGVQDHLEARQTLSVPARESLARTGTWKAAAGASVATVGAGLTAVIIELTRRPRRR
jgi:hypothetical protein